jgi:hypothetical protein
MPTENELLQLILAVFYASIRKEEGRLKQFAVAFVDREQVSEPQGQRGHWYDNARYWSPALFAQERPLSSTILAKLGISPETGQIAVVRGTEGLMIAGVVGSGGNLARFSEGRPGDGIVDNGTHVVLWALGPGAISVRCAGVIVANLVLGQSDVDARFGVTQPVPVGTALGLAEDKRGTGRAKVLPRLLLEIGKRGHGATVVVADECPEEGYRLSANGRSLADARRYVDREQIGFRAPNRYGPGSEEVEAYLKNLDRENYLDDAVRFIADLASLDGALVLDRHLAVLGFGVKLPTSEVPPELVVLCADLEGTSRQLFDFRHFGTRHKSAISFAYSNPGSVVVVVSEDGIATTLVRPTEMEPLLVWRPVTAALERSGWPPQWLLMQVGSVNSNNGE